MAPSHLSVKDMLGSRLCVAAFAVTGSATTATLLARFPHGMAKRSVLRRAPEQLNVQAAAVHSQVATQELRSSLLDRLLRRQQAVENAVKAVGGGHLDQTQLHAVRQLQSTR